MSTRDLGGKNPAVIQRYCTECGAETSGFPFCPRCGTATEDPGPFPGHVAAAGVEDDVVAPGGPRQPADAPAQDPRARSGAHGSGYDTTRVETPPGGRFDALRAAEEIAPTYPDPRQQYGPPPPAYAPPERPHRRWWWIGIGLLVAALLAGGGVAAFLLTRDSATAAYRNKVADAFQPLVNGNKALSDQLTALRGSDVLAAQRAVSAAQHASTSARGALDALTVPAGQQGFQSQATQTLDREDTYLGAVSGVLANPSSPSASQLQTLAGNLTSAFDAAGGPLTGASASVTGADTLTTWAQRASGGQQDGSGGSSSGGSSGGQASTQPQAAGPYANGRDCGDALYAGPNTSCEFAQNVRDAYDAAPGSNASVAVYSPVTGQTYTMDCAPAGAGVTCSGGNDASASWTP